MDYHFTRGQFTEAELEAAIIELFQEQGYEYVAGETLHRGFEEILLKDDLRAFLGERYPDLTATEMETVIGRLENIPSAPLYDGNREAFWLVNEGFDLRREKPGSLGLHIDYIDFETPKNNRFKIVNQFSVQGERLRRPDLLLFINGIPVAIFEFKSAIRESTTIHDAWEQITIRYRRDIPKLMKYCFLGVISDGANTRMGSIFTPYEYYYGWNKIEEGATVASGIAALLAMVRGAFSRKRVIAILRDFVYYPDDASGSMAIVARYPQFFAANKMFANIREHLRPEGDGKGGTYFGATGCGKTYAMLFLARLLGLRDRDRFDNPTVLIITDREDLDRQAGELFVSSKRYLRDTNVRCIESRRDLQAALAAAPGYGAAIAADTGEPLVDIDAQGGEEGLTYGATGAESGGVFLTTIQKFCESTGLLSERSNIICISDEAHRTQIGVGAKLKKTEAGVFTTFGLAKYLRTSFPLATYCGFTGTPIDETLAVFGEVVDSYTMKESSDDGITVRIAYEPRLARVLLSDEQAREIQKYYDKCTVDGANPEQIAESQKAMSEMRRVLGHPDRLARLAKDIVEHYEALTEQKPKIVQKAMIVCSDRALAFELLKNIVALRPDWNEPKRAEDEISLSKAELEKLVPLEKIKLVATQGENDTKELFDLCGTRDYRRMLDRQFKNVHSNFRIAVVVDMWITGFDVPSLAVMYIDKPLTKHSLIQTISRVNRVFEGKDTGLVVDYIGIRNDMMQALKQYGDQIESPVDELSIALTVFRNHLDLIDKLLHGFDASKFMTGQPLERLICLNNAAEYVQASKEMESRFMRLSRTMKSAYEICFPSGELTDEETDKAQFYLAIRSIIYKQTKGEVPDAEVMNSVVEKMVQEAITCTGIENIINADKPEDIFGEEFEKQLGDVKLPITKFNALLKLLRKAISGYGRVNKVKALAFDQRLRKVVDKYNSRDKLVFTSEVVADFIDGLSDELLKLFADLQADKTSFEAMGISFEEKAFYDILVKVRDDHGFDYVDEKCLLLAKAIKKLVDDKTQFADWLTRDDIKNALSMELTVLLYNNGYPPTWNQEIFEKVMEQAENFKRWSD